MEAAPPIGLSRAEAAGVIEMRRLLAALRKDGTEHALVQWRWHGGELHSLKVVDYTVLVGAK